VRPLKLLIGLALLPLCAAATHSLADLINQLGLVSWTHVPAPVAWLVGGFLFWLLIFLCMTRPIRTYVLAHELTHAFWALLMGARVSRLRVSASGGSVTLSKTNFIITLAPYFFPFYTMCVIAAYSLIVLWVDMSTYELFWLALIGFTWSFHLTFTITTLMTRQPDITEHGRLFSYSVIYLLNVLGIGLWIVAVAHPTLQDFGASVMHHGRRIYPVCWEYVVAFGHWLIAVKDTIP
jgi:hypothetical protein